MLGEFEYCNPTKLYFGKNSIEALNQELSKYGKTVMLVYGGGSIKNNGIYQEVVNILNKNNKINVITFKTGSEIDINIFIINGLAM